MHTSGCPPKGPKPIVVWPSGSSSSPASNCRRSQLSCVAGHIIQPRHMARTQARTDLCLRENSHLKLLLPQPSWDTRRTKACLGVLAAPLMIVAPTLPVVPSCPRRSCPSPQSPHGDQALLHLRCARVSPNCPGTSCVHPGMPGGLRDRVGRRCSHTQPRCSRALQP